MSHHAEVLGTFPPAPPGVESWTEEHGYEIERIHYSADPLKDAAWAAAKKKASPTLGIYQQEFEIDPYAQSGALMYPEFSLTLNVIEPFPIPHWWTRYSALDPHKRRPHAFLWCAVNPDNERFYYREYWPSRIYGKRGNVPEDDKLYQIDDYAKTVKWFEGEEVRIFAPGGFADNQGQREKIHRRIQDTHGKAIYAETHDGKDETLTFWDRYEQEGIRCVPPTKDIQGGRDMVGKGLRARKVVDADGERQEPLIHIFNTLPELIHELRTVRFPVLTPTQAAKQDPIEKEMLKRKHLVDCLRYIEMDEPHFIETHDHSAASKKQLFTGVAY